MSCNGLGFDMSNERHPGWLGYIGEYTMQFYGDQNEPLIRIPIKQPIEWKVRFFFWWLI